MKRALLIGGAGFIGHHLAISLKAQGFEIAIIDGLEVNNLLSLQDSRSNFVNQGLYLNVIEERLTLFRSLGISIFVEDARDYVRLSRLVSDFEPDVVFLLAAVSHASRANKDPYSTFDHSFRTLENSLDIVRSLNKTPQFVYFSSSMVYGNFLGLSPNETAHCDPRNIYGALKLGGEKLALAYSEVFNFPVTIVRPSALYGPRCISRRVIQIFIENAIRGKNLVIQGDGNETLDFTYIEDFISGLSLLTLNEKSYGQIFNITRGKGETIIEAAKAVQCYFPNIDIEFHPKDVLNPERGALDINKARSVLQYRPTYDLQDGLKPYIDWYLTKKHVLSLDKMQAEKNE